MIFLGVYKIFNFPKWIIKDKMKIKNEGIILLIIILPPLVLMILVNFILEKIFRDPSINNYMVDALFMGFMWSMAINFKK